MADQKKKLNKLALTGFLLVILLPILMALSLVVPEPLLRQRVSRELIERILIACAILLPLLGRIFSVIGLIMSIVKRQKGKGFAIAGIVISELEFFVYVCIILFYLIIALCGDVKRTIP